MSPIRVSIDHASPLVAAGLLAVLAEAGVDAAIQAAQADVLVADHRTALDALARGSRHRVLVVTHLDGEADVRAALNAGVHGYLLQHCSREDLLTALFAVRRGARHVCATVANVLADGWSRPSLTQREAQVLGLLAQGSCNKIIASQLGISMGTVKAHMRQLLGKLEARSRTEAVVLAAQRGLVRARSTTA